LDVIQSLLVDDFAVAGESRAVTRQRVDEMLAHPLDQQEATEEWGLSPEAIAEGERAQQMLGDAAQAMEDR
jgi:hypothetical protein